MRYGRLVLLTLAALSVAALASRHIGSDALEVPAGASPGGAAAQVCSVPRTAGRSDTGGGSALMVAVSLDEMTDESARIVVGTVQSLRSCLSKDGRSIMTEVVLTPERHLKAPDGPPAPGTKVTILVPGGRFGDFRLVVGTSPEFSVGERVVVLLREVKGEGLRLTEGFQSKFSVKSGDLMERANLSLAEFEANVRHAMDGILAPQEDPLFQPGFVVVEQPFEILQGKWPDADIPVNYNINPTTNRPGQLSADQSRQAVINGFNTWEAVPTSSIAFNNAGDTGRVSGADVCGPPDFFNDITWGVADSHDPSTLAVTHDCFFTTPDPDEFLDADIELDIDHFGELWRVDGSGSCASGLFDLETVMLHEEGHFLGLGHPSANPCVDGGCPVMNAFYNGVRRTLCADDINGVTSLYLATPTATPIPPPGDDTIGVYRPSTAQFHLSNNNAAAAVSVAYGNLGDVPIVGDWDGNRTDTIGIYRPSTAQFHLSNNNAVANAGSFTYGNPSDVPLAGDWNGDGIDTIGVYRPSTAQFFLSNNNAVAAVSVPYGNPGDVPIDGDWDGS